MSPKPPHGPDPQTTMMDYRQSEALLNQLWELTQEILPLSTGQDLPALNRLIHRRGVLVEQCRQIPLQSFTEAQQTTLQGQFDRCKAVDIEIEHNMRNFQKHIDGQLKHLQQSQKLLDKYQSGGDPEARETRSQDA